MILPQIVNCIYFEESGFDLWLTVRRFGNYVSSLQEM